MKLTIIGGTYLELCQDPQYEQLYGSGLRAVAPLADIGSELNFVTCVDQYDLASAESLCETFGATPNFTIIPQTVAFHYYHPLAVPTPISSIIDQNPISLAELTESNVLYYGLIEATVKVNADYLVYDPQNHVSYRETGSTASHLALVMNKKEALQLSSLPSDTDLGIVGKNLLDTENAEVVIIKNGSHGALVVDTSGCYNIPVFKTPSVWPIGSGDIFSATFAWKWMIEKLAPKDAAFFASQYTATFCATRKVPLPKTPINFEPVTARLTSNNIYLAAPFFTVAERWLVNELKMLLEDFGNRVFSPFHDVGLLTATEGHLKAKEIAGKDLQGLRDADVVLAVVNQIDAGTLFEIGYARSLNKRVVIFSENIHPNDLTMLVGTDCELVGDLSSAVYSASW